MDKDIFSKMKVKPESKGLVLNAPNDYPENEFASGKGKNAKYDFVNLFVENQKQFTDNFSKAAAALNGSGGNVMFWIAYPKGSSKTKCDINRDIMWDLCIPLGFHPVALVSLDEKWSAVRMKPNEEGVVYSRPGKK